MAMIAIPVPHDVSEILRGLDIPGKRDISDHITLFYLGDDVDIKTIIKCINSCLKVTEKQKTFIVELKGYSCFPEGNDGVPVICNIENRELQKLRNRLARKLDSAKIEYSKKFKEYRPHVTLSYNKDKVEDGTFPKIAWQVNKVAIYGGDGGKEKLYAELSFGGKINKTANYIDDLSEYYFRIATE